MATRLGQYQQALRAIGDQRLASLTENVPARKVLDDIWLMSCDYMLSLAHWKFARRVASLTPDPSVTASFGPTYGYSVPSDLLRLTGISTDEMFVSELHTYDEHDGHWWTNVANPIFIAYTSNDPLFGMNLGKWPVHFALAHAYYMAAESGLQITKVGTSRERLLGEHMRSLDRSKTLDAIGKATERKPMGTWTTARLGGNSTPERDGATNQSWE